MSERLLARPPFAGSSGTGQAPAPSSAQPAPASLPARLRTAWCAPRSPQAVALVLALWLLATANWALWLRLPHLEGYDGSLATLRMPTQLSERQAIQQLVCGRQTC